MRKKQRRQFRVLILISSVAATYLFNGLATAEAELPNMVLVQFLDAQRQVGRRKPAACSVISGLACKLAAESRVVCNDTQHNVPVHRAAVLQCGRDKHRSLTGGLEGHRPQVEVGNVKAEFCGHVPVQPMKRGHSGRLDDRGYFSFGDNFLLL